MTEKEYFAKSAHTETCKAQAKLDLARRKRESGRAKLDADFAKAELDLQKAKITRDEEYDALQLALHEAELDLLRCRAYEAHTRANADQGFEQ